MHKIYLGLKFIALVFVFAQCNQPIVSKQKIEQKHREPGVIGYHIAHSKIWLKEHLGDSIHKNIILALNRVDVKHLVLLDTIIVPDDLSGDLAYYMPFPFTVAAIKSIPKIIFFSYPTQSFAAYEMGELVYIGPVSMGRQNDQTPTGLYFTNWKAEKTTSTFNDEWDLKWNFNIENKLGIGFHEYDLPGYPASHSCLRLLEKDAIFLYNWADQWVLNEKNKDSVQLKGTPVIVFGSYAFGSPKPWLQLPASPHVLDIAETDIQKLVEPFMQNIIAEGQKSVAEQIK